MAAARHETRQRGLPSLNEARVERRSALVRGKYALSGGFPPRFWLWAGVVLAATSVIYWKVAQGKLESQKSAVMAKQRAVAQALAPEVVPHTKLIESLVRSLAGKVTPVSATSEELAKVQASPGVYLRLGLADAVDEKHLQKAAADSLHDAFVACFFARKDVPDPTKGLKCKNSSDCVAGQLCNEYEVCSLPPRPYNMRLAYRALQVLGASWSDELHETGNEYEVRIRERELERVAHDDVPIAIRMMQSSRYFVLVLDEPPSNELPEKISPSESDEQRIQRVPHWARIGMWEIPSGRAVMAIRAEASGSLVPVGERRVVLDAETRAAQQRQVNSCSLATEVKFAAIRGAGSPAIENVPAGP